MLEFSSVMRRALRTVLPVNCSMCETRLTDDPVPFFCRSCWSSIEPFRGPSCPRCHAPFPSPVALLHSPTHLCGACRSNRPAYTEAYSRYPYVSPLQEAICLFKYRRKVTMAEPLADLMGAAVPPGLHLDLILPVPLHPARLREREFNQSLLLADHMSRHLRVPISHMNLIRTRQTEPQTELRRAARLKNLRKAFSVQKPEQLAGKRLLLVDDVMTTGTTVNECAKILRKRGAAAVYVLTIARSIGADLISDRRRHMFALNPLRDTRN